MSGFISCKASLGNDLCAKVGSALLVKYEQVVKFVHSAHGITCGKGSSL
ncbi:hypothetical protein SCOR_08070 [Sulfidibacter corallicola]